VSSSSLVLPCSRDRTSAPHVPSRERQRNVRKDRALHRVFTRPLLPGKPCEPIVREQGEHKAAGRDGSRRRPGRPQSRRARRTRPTPPAPTYRVAEASGGPRAPSAASVRTCPPSERSGHLARPKLMASGPSPVGRPSRQGARRTHRDSVAEMRVVTDDVGA
jgi:hypothetical protein